MRARTRSSGAVPAASPFASTTRAPPPIFFLLRLPYGPFPCSRRATLCFRRSRVSGRVYSQPLHGSFPSPFPGTPAKLSCKFCCVTTSGLYTRPAPSLLCPAVRPRARYIPSQSLSKRAVATVCTSSRTFVTTCDVHRTCRLAQMRLEQKGATERSRFSTVSWQVCRPDVDKPPPWRRAASPDQFPSAQPNTRVSSLAQIFDSLVNQSNRRFPRWTIRSLFARSSFPL